MFKKWTLRSKIIQVLKNPWTNWEDKGAMLNKIIYLEHKGIETLLAIIEKDRDPKIRKAAASVLVYMNIFSRAVAPQLIQRIFIEKDWQVRFALSRTVAQLLKEQAVDELQKEFLLQSNLPKSLSEEYQLKLRFTEGLGWMGLPEGIPILTSFLTQEKSSHGKQSNSLKVQIIYSLGEVGDESVIDLLMEYSEATLPEAKSTKQSAINALDKIAKRLGFTSKRDLLTKRSQE